MRLILQNDTNHKVTKTLFTDILLRANPKKDVELLLTNNAEIQALNSQYRHKNQPTDVLSFQLNEDELLGQIIISVEKAQEQAKEIGQTVNKELQFLFAHGLAHLLGHDHETDKEEADMLAFVYKILNRQQPTVW